MRGHPLTAALSDEARREHPVQWVATHETGERERGAAVASARGGEDLEKMLRSLGYLGGTGDAATVAGDGTCEQTVNLATVLMNQDRFDEAIVITSYSIHYTKLYDQGTVSVPVFHALSSRYWAGSGGVVGEPRLPMC